MVAALSRHSSDMAVAYQHLGSHTAETRQRHGNDMGGQDLAWVCLPTLFGWLATDGTGAFRRWIATRAGVVDFAVSGAARLRSSPTAAAATTKVPGRGCHQRQQRHRQRHGSSMADRDAVLDGPFASGPSRSGVDWWGAFWWRRPEARRWSMSDRSACECQCGSHGAPNASALERTRAAGPVAMVMCAWRRAKWRRQSCDSGSEMAATWRQRGSDKAATWQRCGSDVAVAWQRQHHGTDLRSNMAATWRQHGSGIAATWRHGSGSSMAATRAGTWQRPGDSSDMTVVLQ